MIPVLFLAAMASADPAYDRLFGGDAATAEASPAAELPAGGFVWPALLAGAGIAAAWQLRKKALGGTSQSGMRIVQRQVVGDKNSLLLVEVDDGAGGQRRLLLGSSQAGLALVQDLGPAGGAPRSFETFTDALPEVETETFSPRTASAPYQNLSPQAATPSARPNAAQVRVQAAAFAEVLDEVMSERGLDPAVDSDESVADEFFGRDESGPYGRDESGAYGRDESGANGRDESGPFSAGNQANRQRFFTEDDLAPEGEDEIPAPVVRRRTAAVARELRPAPPSPVAPIRGEPPVRQTPVRHEAVAATVQPEPVQGLRAILGGRSSAQLPANARIVSSYGTTRNVTAESVPAADHHAATPIVALPPMAAAAPAPVAFQPIAAPRTFVGPALENPILLAAPARESVAERETPQIREVATPRAVATPAAIAARVVSLPPAPAPTALDSSRARLQRLAQAATKPSVERPADLDNLVRRFDAVAASGRR